MLQKTLFDGTKIPAIWQGGSKISDSEMQIRVWENGIHHGCNAIDTAELYGNGLSEKTISELFNRFKREEIFIADKVAPQHLKYNDVLEACSNSLKRLQIDYIDLYQIHWTNPNVPLEETLGALLTLHHEGKILHIGVCNFTLYQIELCNEILDNGLASVQLEYNLINRTCEKEIIPYCDKNNILFIGYSPLNGGTTVFSNSILKSIAKKYHITVAQLVLNWEVSKFNMVVTPKSSTFSHILENSQATDFLLERCDYDAIAKEFNRPIIKLHPSDITCMITGGNEFGNQECYTTIEGALKNKVAYFPSPQDVAKELSITNALSKPIYVHKNKGRYELVGGNVRYWGWVIAYGWDSLIECIVVKETL